MAATPDADGRLELDGDDSQTLMVDVGGDGQVHLPEGLDMGQATFSMAGDNLVMTFPDGTQVVVRDFLDGDTPPNLVQADGTVVDGSIAAQMGGHDANALSVSVDGPGLGGGDMIGGTDGTPIGTVEKADGDVTAIRADGTEVQLQEGDPVFQGDVLVTGDDGAVGIMLADQTSFSMGENGNMTLDEMVYDPGSEQGSLSFSVLEGAFTFVSGTIAKTDPDAMVLKTPVATIGIRGTQVGLDINDEGQMDIVLMEEADGFVGEVAIYNEGGLEVMNVANQFTSVSDFRAPPNPVTFLDAEQLVGSFETPLRYLPKTDSNNANDFNLQEADFNTEAGGENGEDLNDFNTEAGGQTEQGAGEIKVTKVDLTQGVKKEVQTDDLFDDTIEIASGGQGGPTLIDDGIVGQ
ncbi:MAG: FecR family protein, partial [Rhodospirillales bacterium]